MPIGELTHDGPPTPEQLSLFLPVMGNLPFTATTTVRYKEATGTAWKMGHPLHRIRRDLAAPPPANPIPDGFAWPIIDLSPGTAYDVEVTVIDGGVSELKKATFTTRALPPPAGPPNKMINRSAMVQAAFRALAPGDVIQFANGTYHVDDLKLDVAGTASRPIYIRGQSRDGVVLIAERGIVLSLLNAGDIVIENLTLRGSGVNNRAQTAAIAFIGGVRAPQARVTVRNMSASGVDQGIVAAQPILQFLGYNNTLFGNDTWTAAQIDTDSTWNDDGINLPGRGNCAWNNTLRGFGDCFAYSANDGDIAVGIHYYRNDTLDSGDDFIEADYSYRNCSAYDNRVHNAMTFLSLDPVYGGPYLFARNIGINIGRVPFKWNNTNTGMFVYNNTIIRTTGPQILAGEPESEAGWMQHDNGSQRVYGYRNNILIYLGRGEQTLVLNSTAHNPIDFTHNSWFPDKIFQWPEGTFGGLAAAYNSLPPTTPVFSGSTRRHEHDNTTVAQPWTVPVNLGANYREAVTPSYLPTLANGMAPKNSGIAIANITDGYSGSAPDRGAIIAGRPVVAFGDKAGILPPSSSPASPSAPLPRTPGRSAIN